MRTWWKLIGLCVLSVMMGTAAAEACGALIPSDQSVAVTQQAERVIFSVDRQNESITAYVQIAYEGNASDFAWILPVPSAPEIAVADAEAFTELQALTEPRVLFPPAPECEAAMNLDGALGGAPPGGPIVLSEGEVGPYDTVVLSSAGSDVVSWLQQEGYPLSDELSGILGEYAAAGMDFVAIKLRDGQGSNAITPLAITFKGTEPMIPLRLAASSAREDTPIYAWIFADAPATPANAVRLTMVRSDLAQTDTSGNSNYVAQRSGAIENTQPNPGHGFFVEYTQPTSELGATNSLLQELASKHQYLTRLYGEMSPEQMTIDPRFTFDAALPDISNIIDLGNRVAPYECTDEGLELHTIRRQQFDASRGPGAKSPEEATKDLRRGPLALISALIVGGLIVLVVVLGRRPAKRRG